MTTSLPTTELTAASSRATTVLNRISELIVEAVGEDELFDIEIEADTTFQDDLELESLEFVVLAGLLKDEWGEQVDFVAWLAEMDLDEILSLAVSDLVAFVEEALAR